MASSPSLLRGGNSCKTLSSIAGFLSKSSSSPRFRFVWESDRRNQLAPIPDDKLLYLKAKAPQSNQSLIKSITSELDCHFEIAPTAVHIHPSKTVNDSKDLLQDLLRQLVRIKSPGQTALNLWGQVTPEKIVVEYGSPNIAKPLHMGHLRSTVTGNYIAQLCKHAGHTVTSMCFLGDWGTQFGLLQAGLAKWGTRDGASVAESLEKLDIRSLLQFYIQASTSKDPGSEMDSQAKEYTSLLERSDAGCLKTWSIIREKSVQHLQSAWDQLGIHFDVVQSESEFAVNSDTTSRVLEVLKAKGYLDVDEKGCIFANVPSTINTDAMAKVPLVKSNGTSIYLLRDIGAGLHRFENFEFNRMIYVVDKAQSQHFVNLFHLLVPFGYDSARTSGGQKGKGKMNRRYVEHVSFGQVLGMSSRAGTFVLLSDAVEDGFKFMKSSRNLSPNTRWAPDHDLDAETTLKLTVSSLITYFLKSKRQRDITFNWVEAIKLTGETGMKLQYTHARLKSLETKLGFDKDKELTNPDEFCDQVDFDYILRDPMAIDLVVHLLNFEDSFWASYNDMEPCILLTHLFHLCEKASKALKYLNVKTEKDPSVAATRLRLFVLTRHILGIGMNIVGITPLDQI